MSDRTRLFGGACVAVGVFVPLVTHVVFKLNTPLGFLEPVWKAGDFLQYVAGLLGAFATLIAVLLTIDDEREGRLEEQRLSVIPLVAITACEGGLCDLVEVDEDYRLGGSAASGTGANHPSIQTSDIEYIVVDQYGSVDYPSHLSDEQISGANNHAYIEVDGPGGVKLTTVNNMRFDLLKLSCVGNGPAINMSVFLDCNKGMPMFEGSPVHLPTKQLLVGDIAYIGILFENVRFIENYGTYALVIRYFNAMSTYQYEQRHVVKVRPTIKDGKTAVQIKMDFNINQKLIREPDKGITDQED